MLYTTSKTSGDAIQAKHQPLTPNRTDIMPLSVIHIPLLLTPNNPFLSIDQKSHINMKWIFKFKNFSNLIVLGEINLFEAKVLIKNSLATLAPYINNKNFNNHMEIS